MENRSSEVSKASAELMLNTLSTKQEAENEFESLRPKPFSQLFLASALLIIFIIVGYLNIEKDQYDVFFYILMAYFMVNVMIYNESRRINKRIDLLARILKD